MAKLVVTEAGRKLQEEIKREEGIPIMNGSLVHKKKLSNDDILMENVRNSRAFDNASMSKSQSFSPNKTKLNHNSSEKSQFDEAYNIPLTISEKKKLQLLNDEVLKKSPYISHKVLKMTRELDKYSPKKIKIGLYSPQSTLMKLQNTHNSDNSNIGGPSMKQMTIESTIFQTNPIINDEIYSNASNKKDESMVMKHEHYKIQHIESTIEKIIDRYKNAKNRFDEVEKQIDKKYQDKMKLILEQNQKPPEYLENIRQNNPEALEIIAYQTRAEFRHRNRIAHAFDEKYSKYWANVHADERKFIKNKQ